MGALTWHFGQLAFDEQRGLTLKYLLKIKTEGIDSTNDPRDTTSSLCGAGLNCVEAYDTAEATYFRFASRNSATAFAASQACGFQWIRLVMDSDRKTDVPKKFATLGGIASHRHLAGLTREHRPLDNDVLERSIGPANVNATILHMTTLSLADARAISSEPLESAVTTHERFEVTRNGTGSVSVLRANDQNALLKTVDILSRAEEVADIRQVIDDSDSGDVFNLAEVRAAMVARGRLPE